MAEELLDALANETNRAILSLLAVEPTYPRSVSQLMGLSESDASRRLSRLEDVGLVESSWEHVDGRNVKTYRLVADRVSVEIGGEGLTVETNAADQAPREAVVDRLDVDPPDPGDFVGRRDELAALEGPEPVVLVEGIAGIGKTSLAAAYADRRPDGDAVFFHSFTGMESLTWLAHRLGVLRARQGDTDLLDAVEAGAPLADIRELVLEALDRGDQVTVFDAVERIRDEDLEQLVVDAAGTVRDGRLVVTGRRIPARAKGDPQVQALRLDGLSVDDVDRLLDRRGLDGDAERVRERLGGHPLAVQLLAEAAEEGSVDELVDEAPDHEIEAYLLEEVQDQLSETETNVLAYASVFHGPFTRDDLAAVYPGNPGGALVRLRRRRLLRDEGSTFRVHDLLASFFVERLDDPAEVHERAAEHALDEDTLEARLDALYHLLEAGKRGRLLGLLERDLDLAEFDLIEEGYHNLYRDVLEKLEPDEMPDDRRAGIVFDELGDIRLHRDEPEQALDRYEAAAERFRAVDGDERLADLAWKQALALRDLERIEAAREQVQVGLSEHEPDERTRERLLELAEDLGVQVRSER